jgi:hypothetical protein
MLDSIAKTKLPGTIKATRYINTSHHLKAVLVAV